MAILDAVVVVVTSLLVGGGGIFAGVRLLADETVRFESALLTALTGAATWGIIAALVGLVPFVAPLSALVVWVTVITLRHAEGWATAAVIGFVAWTASVMVLYALGTTDVVSLSALGVPDVTPVAVVVPAVYYTGEGT